jgi:hypothetical protein
MDYSQIDFADLRKQKLTLLEIISDIDRKENKTERDKLEAEHLEGILGLLDFVQDSAEEKGEMWVFSRPLSAEEWKEPIITIERAEDFIRNCVESFEGDFKGDTNFAYLRSKYGYRYFEHEEGEILDKRMEEVTELFKEKEENGGYSLNGFIEDYAAGMGF